MKASSQMSSIDPLIEWLPLTSHATSAIIQPPTMALQKMVESE